MDVCEVLQRLQRRRENDTLKQPSTPTEKNNGTVTRPSRTREVTSRYKSPTPPASRRCASPNSTRTTANSSTQLTPKRAVSADRKRPSAPPSLSLPTSPVHDTSAEPHSRRITGSKLPDMLWPSRMRNLSASYHTDRTLKPSSNVPQKATLERSPIKGKHSSDQSENSRPTDGFQARLVDQHRWASRAGGKLSYGPLTKNTDLLVSDKAGKSSSVLLPSIGVSSLRRLSAEGMPRPLHMHTSDAGGAGHALIDEIAKTTSNLKEVDTVLRISNLHKLSMPKSFEIPSSVAAGITSRSLPGSRLPSPSKASASRGRASPSRTRPSTPTSSKGTSPSGIKPSSPTQQMGSATSVLSFIYDLKKGKKSTNQSEEAHHLRLLYNRYSQWRFANAQAEAALHIQKLSAEETLYSVWRETLELWDSVIKKRIDIQQLQLQLKLNVVFNEQLASLEDWAVLERDHSASLAGAINDLESSTIRLPITDGAWADIVSLKASINSAFDMMQAMTSSIYSVLPKAEATNYLASELADLAAEERAMLDECEAMLASTATMQDEEYCLRVQLIQQMQG